MACLACEGWRRSLRRASPTRAGGVRYCVPRRRKGLEAFATACLADKGWRRSLRRASPGKAGVVRNKRDSPARAEVVRKKRDSPEVVSWKRTTSCRGKHWDETNG